MADEVMGLVERFRAAVVEGDDSAIAAMSAPGSTVWHNSDGVAAPPGPDGLAQLHRVLDDVAMEIDQVIPTPTGFVLRFTLRGRARRSGLPWQSRSCVVVELEEGKLARTFEYADSAPTADLFGP